MPTGMNLRFLSSTNGFELSMKHFTKDSSGSVTIEFVLWVPIMFLFLLFAIDSSLAFMRQSQMWQVSRETARIVSRYGMDEATAEAYASSRAVFGTTAAAADVTFGSGDVQVTMSVPIGALAPFGTLNLIMADLFTTRVTHAMEPL